MMRLARLLPFCFALAILASCVSPPGDTMVGSHASDFKVESLAYKKLTKLSEMKGRVVLLDFWATWCGPCRSAMPEVQEAYDRFGPKGFDVMAVTDEDRDTVEKFRKAGAHTYPVYLDPFDEASAAYEVKGLPKFVLIGRDGRVIWSQEGYDDGSSKMILKAVEQAFE